LPHAAARTKKKRKKAAAPAVPAAASDNDRLQPQPHLPPLSQRRARGPARRKPQSPLTFAQCRCGQRQPTAQVIMLWQLPTGRSGLLAMLQPSMMTLLMSPCPVASCTRKGCPARELHQAPWTLLACPGHGDSPLHDATGAAGTHAGVDQQEVVPTINGSSAMMEDDGAGSRQQEREEGNGEDKW
jgi:hypothetical protein